MFIFKSITLSLKYWFRVYAKNHILYTLVNLQKKSTNVEKYHMVLFHPGTFSVTPIFTYLIQIT